MSKIGADSPLTTSVWHRPLVPEQAKDQMAKRQANAALALLRLRREQMVWPILQHRPDPRTRSYLIHRFRPLDADPRQVLTQLDTEGEVSIRRALILILGEFNEQQLPPVERERLTPRLLDLYANDPDPGIHGAVSWTLRQWKRQTELEQADRSLATGKAEGNRRWLVNGQVQTLAIIPAPGEFVIGSPPNELGREGGPEGDLEMQRYVRIDHSFAVMSHLVTVAEFLRFRKDFYYRDTYSPGPVYPINNVSWYDSAAYCNWLNEQEGISREQWCYLPNDQGEYAQGMRIAPHCLQRIGYRLPTEAEWEFACRAGSITSRYFGQSPDLDNHYAWGVQNSLGRRAAPVGAFKPNDLGLFDLLGNVMQWCHTSSRDYPSPVEDKRNSDPAQTEVVRDQAKPAFRGSSFVQSIEEARAARKPAYPPNVRIFAVGLRVSRTYLLAKEPEWGAELKNSQPRLTRGSFFSFGFETTRTCYGPKVSPNFAVYGMGFRAARTMF